MRHATLYLDAKAELAEGPVWDDRTNRLSWIDIERGELHLDKQVFRLGVKIGAAVPCQSGQFLLATANGFELFDPVSERRTPLADPEREIADNRMNDGKSDARGRFWGGSLSTTRQPGTAAFYVLDGDGSVRKAIDGLTNSNGLGWSPDGRTLYHIDTPTLEVRAFDFDLDSTTLSGRRTVVRFPDGVGRPDGMCVDAEGFLWIAHWNGGCVSRWNPVDGRQLESVSLPVRRVSSCCFGDADLGTLYITTARHGLSEEELERQPIAGGIFSFRPGVPGLPMTPFDDRRDGNDRDSIGIPLAFEPQSTSEVG